MSQQFANKNLISCLIGKHAFDSDGDELTESFRPNDKCRENLIWQTKGAQLGQRNSGEKNYKKIVELT